MTNYRRAGSYLPNETISRSTRMARGIGEKRDYGHSARIHPVYRANDGDRNENREGYNSRSKLPSLVGQGGSYDHLREKGNKLSLDSIPVAVRSGVYSAE